MLGEVVVSADLEAENPIERVPLRREHHDRNGGCRANPSEDVESVGASDHDVQQDKAIAARQRALRAGGGIRHAVDLEPFGCEKAIDELAQLAVVVNQQEARESGAIDRVHRPIVGVARRARA